MRLYESGLLTLERLASRHWYRLGDEDVMDLGRLRGLDARMIRKTSAELFDPDDLEIILVGDPDLIRAQLARLKLGTIELIDPERRPVKDGPARVAEVPAR